MKKFILSLLLVVLSLNFVACQSTSTVKPDFNQVLIQNESSIQLASNLATTAAMLTVDQKDRVATARLVYEVAAAINAAVDTQNTTQVDLTALTDTLFQSQNLNDRIIAGSIVNTLNTLISSYVRSQLNVAAASTQPSEAEQVQAVQALMRAASSGVMNATLIYTQGAHVKAVSGALRATAPVPFVSGGNIKVYHKTWSSLPPATK